jgi:hypothetical protein
MKIRFFSYSIELRDLIYTLAAIYLGVILANKIGFIKLVALMLAIYGAATTLRCLLFWLLDEGPFIGRPVGDTLKSVSFLLIGLILLFV